MHDIRYDEVHDEILMANTFAQAILVFRGGANGEEPPIRLIQGPSTQLVDPDRVEVDPVHNEIFVLESEFILVFPGNANGNVAPIRVIRGPDTRLKGTKALSVDPVHNVLVATVDNWNPRGSALVIFNRTDNGNVKPKAVIAGSNTGLRGLLEQVLVYPPKGLILTVLSGSGGDEDAVPRREIAVWNINDNGDTPPLVAARH